MDGCDHVDENKAYGRCDDVDDTPVDGSKGATPQCGLDGCGALNVLLCGSLLTDVSLKSLSSHIRSVPC